MKILLIDNYDSFTYNLLHYAEMNDEVEVTVFRNDEISVETPDRFDKIILSPGPGLPEEAGLMNNIILKYADRKPMLGVCLGMQAMAVVFGGKLYNLPEVMHGVARPVYVTDKTDSLFLGLPDTFSAGRYHSWVVEKETLPGDFNITAVDDKGYIMALRHKTKNICGVQFHPESVLTEYGQQMMKNWIVNDL